MSLLILFSSRFNPFYVCWFYFVSALEPFFNAAASQFILGQPIPLTLWLSLAPVVIGKLLSLHLPLLLLKLNKCAWTVAIVMLVCVWLMSAGVSMASLTELSFNWTGFISAMISNVSFTYRSIYSKKAMVIFWQKLLLILHAQPLIDFLTNNLQFMIASSLCRLIWTVLIYMPIFRSLRSLSAFHQPSLWVKETLRPFLIPALNYHYSLLSLFLFLQLEGPQLMKYGFSDAIAKVGLVKFASDLFWVGMFYHLYNQVCIFVRSP